MTDEQQNDGFTLMLNEAIKDKDKSEMAMKWVIELIRSFGDMGNWLNEALSVMNGQMYSLQEQIDELQGDTTQIAADDAEKMLKLIEAFKWLVSESLSADQTEEGKAKVNELLQLANDCDELIKNSILSEEEEGAEESKINSDVQQQ